MRIGAVLNDINIDRAMERTKVVNNLLRYALNYAAFHQREGNINKAEITNDNIEEILNGFQSKGQDEPRYSIHFSPHV